LTQNKTLTTNNHHSSSNDEETTYHRDILDIGVLLLIVLQPLLSAAYILSKFKIILAAQAMLKRV
jgi:hypothetical protein